MGRGLGLGPKGKMRKFVRLDFRGVSDVGEYDSETLCATTTALTNQTHVHVNGFFTFYFFNLVLVTRVCK